jgi:carboxyl-terminal processing protease
VAGGSTQQKGVEPDIVLPSVLDALELGETTLPYYLPYDTVPAASYTTFNLVSPYISQLKANSAWPPRATSATSARTSLITRRR